MKSLVLVLLIIFSASLKTGQANKQLFSKYYFSTKIETPSPLAPADLFSSINIPQNFAKNKIYAYAYYAESFLSLSKTISRPKEPP